MRIKIGLLYFLIFLFLSCCAYAIFQCIPEETEEEEPYEYSDLHSAVEITGDDDSNAISLQYDYDALKAQNADFMGWLHIPDTEISFPVVMGADNDYYLNHGFSGTYSQFGCPFIDVRTPLGSENVVIHGHNMGNNRSEIFSTLLYYQDTEYAKNHSRIFFSSGNQEIREYELFAVCNINVDASSLDYYQASFDEPTKRAEFLRNLQQCSLYPAADIPNGQIMILSTCNRAYGADNRLLIVAAEKS